MSREEAVSAGKVKAAARTAPNAETASGRGALRLGVHVTFGCLEAAERLQALTGSEEVRVFGELQLALRLFRQLAPRRIQVQHVEAAAVGAATDLVLEGCEVHSCAVSATDGLQVGEGRVHAAVVRCRTTAVRAAPRFVVRTVVKEGVGRHVTLHTAAVHEVC